MKKTVLVSYAMVLAMSNAHADLIDYAAPINASENPAKTTMNPVRLALKSGADALLAGDAKLANHEFNLAIARDLKNPALHAANALAYQIRTRAGERDLFDLAETGYLVALEKRGYQVIAPDEGSDDDAPAATEATDDAAAPPQP